MICQRCGNCCVTMMVLVADPETQRFKMKPSGGVCPNLSIGEDGEASCAVHDEPWYSSTPCFTYGNPDQDPDYALKRGRPCRVGEMFREQRLDVTEGAERKTFDELEDMDLTVE